MNYSLSVNGEKFNGKTLKDFQFIRQKYQKQAREKKSFDIPLDIKPTSQMRTRRIISSKSLIRSHTVQEEQEIVIPRKSSTKRQIHPPNFPFNLNYTISRLHEATSVPKVYFPIYKENQSHFTNRVEIQKEDEDLFLGFYFAEKAFRQCLRSQYPKKFDGNFTMAHQDKIENCLVRYMNSFDETRKGLTRAVDDD
ncbi:hypothetical protein pb186bvf_003203 [Paramecium bursaria]